jgi:hypothetical protein
MKKEPAIIIGILIALLTVLGQVAAGDVTWAAAVPVLAGIVTRFFVSPADA